MSLQEMIWCHLKILAILGSNNKTFCKVKQMVANKTRILSISSHCSNELSFKNRTLVYLLRVHVWAFGRLFVPVVFFSRGCWITMNSFICVLIFLCTVFSEKIDIINISKSVVAFKFKCPVMVINLMNFSKVSFHLWRQVQLFYWHVFRLQMFNGKIWCNKYFYELEIHVQEAIIQY